MHSYRALYLSILTGSLLTVLSMAAAANEVKGTIDGAKSVTGIVRGAGLDVYTFEMAKKGSIIASLSETGPHVKGFNPLLQLMKDDANLGGSGGDYYAKVYPMQEMEAGSYRLEVSRPDKGMEGGNYQLRLIELPGTKGTPMKFSKTYQGTITRGGLDVYTFTGTPDVMATLVMMPTKGEGFRPNFIIYGPDGTSGAGGSCAEQCNNMIQMQENGEYTLVIGRDDQTDKPGSYAVSIERADGGGPIMRPLPPAVVQASKKQQTEMEKAMAEVARVRAAADYGHRVEVYKNGMFLTFSAADLDSRDLKEPNPEKLVGYGDASMPEGKTAISYWLRAAELGNADAVNRLGMMYSQFYKDKTFETAPWYKQVVAQEGDSSSIDEANKYLTGSGAGRDFIQMKKMYKYAAEQGSAAAQFNLASLSTITLDVPPDYKEAAKWYRKAAEQGIIVAENNLAQLYERGEGVKQDDSQAADWYLKAAESGYPPALYGLAKLSAAGRGMPKDPEKAASWLKLAAAAGYTKAKLELAVQSQSPSDAKAVVLKAAAAGDADALRSLALLYRKQPVAEADRDAVLEIYRKASEKVNPQAYAATGDFFANQSQPDNLEAAYWYRLAAAALDKASLPPEEKQELVNYTLAAGGKAEKQLTTEELGSVKGRVKDALHIPPPAERTLAEQLYSKAEKAMAAGNTADALLFYIQAAKLDYALAQWAMGNVYSSGRSSRPLTPDRAIAYYKQAVANGIAGPATQLGDIYRFGIMVPADNVAAAHWYEIDANRGAMRAVNALGGIYATLNTPEGGRKLVSIYEKAAFQKQSAAYDTLGMLYLYGFGGVVKNPQTALKWYLLADHYGQNVGSIQAATILKDYEPHDYAKALKLLGRAGGGLALNNLGYMYAHKLGSDDVKPLGTIQHNALEYYTIASAQCDGRAMYNIAKLFESGADAPEISPTPVQKDEAATLKWMESAANYGSLSARIWLAQHDPNGPKVAVEIPAEEVMTMPEPCPQQGAAQ